MKKLSQAIALVAVTTLFATAFTTSYKDQPTTTPAQATAPGSNVAQVVIVGKRMTASEKAQYDADVSAQASLQPANVEQSGFHIAVK
jgi:hypothetical protein